MSNKMMVRFANMIALGVGLLITAPVFALQQSEEEQAYLLGTQAVNELRWQDAIRQFEQVVEMGGDREDAALYWKAYALEKSGNSGEALEVLRVLRQQNPSSEWQRDAGALELEIRQRAGQQVSPADQENDELKVLALQGLLRTSPGRALPALKQLASSDANPKLRRKALFLLAQAGTPEAQEIIIELARNSSQPESQRKAIDVLGVFGSEKNRSVLQELYTSSTDLEVRKAILRSYMVAGDKERLLRAARTEQDDALARQAIRMLGAAGARMELKQLYDETADGEARKTIINGLFVAGDRDTLRDLALGEDDPLLRREAIEKLGLAGGVESLGSMYQEEQDPSTKKDILKALFVGGAQKELEAILADESSADLRREGIRFLGLMGRSTAESLLSIYADPTSDPQTRQAVVEALFLQGNATALVNLARQAPDPETRKMMVEKLSLMDSPEARDYLLELLQN